MVKVHKLVTAIATTITLSTTSAYALELGDISWQSSFGQPLKAKIALKDTAGVKASDINSTLSRSVNFDDLPSLSFNPVILDNGSGYIEVKSNTPVNEPFLTFAIDVKYNGNTLTKEYNVLLDMASEKNTVSTKAKAITKPNTTKTAEPKTNTSSTYKTSRGETLWTIAQKTYSTNLTARASKAIYDKNPKAFINGQHTQILADYTLKLPTQQEVNAISVADANAFISGKAVAQKTTTTNTTTATTAVENTKEATAIQNKLQASEQALADARNENEQLSSQLENLQSEIDRLQTISNEKDVQITEIKTKLAEPVKNDTPETPAVTQETKQDANTSQESTAPTQSNDTKAAPETKQEEAPPTVEPKEVPVETATIAEKSSENSAPKAPAQEKPKPIQQPDPMVDEPSFLSSLLGNQTLMMAGGGALILLCIIALLIRRKKAMNDDAEEVDLSNVSLDDEIDTPETEASLETDSNTATEDPISKLGEGMGVLDKVDIYLLYHHYDQAKALLKTAIEEEPTNTEYYLKLLEILAEKDDKESFTNESEFLLLIDPMAQHKIDAIKDKYNFNNVTAHQENLASVSDDTQHIALEESNASHSDILFNQENNDSFNPSFSFSQDDDSQKQGLQRDEDVFSFDEPTFTVTNTKTDDEQTIAEGTHAFFNTQQSDDNSSFNLDIEEPHVQNELTEDFSFDMNPKDSPVEIHAEQSSVIEPVVETPTNSAIDENNDDIIEKDQVTTKLELVNAYINMNDEEGAQDLLEEIIKEGNETQKAEAQRLLASLSNNTATVEETPLTSKEAASTSNSTSVSHNDATLTELDLGFALSAEDEVVTKLELAKAYIDMGDKTGAKDILEEVLSEGSESQKQEALELIRSLNA